MTITSTTVRTAYAGDGVSVNFVVPFVFFGPDEVQVMTQTGGIINTMARAVDYTVFGGNGGTGSVTTIAAPASGTTLILRRATARTQQAAYTDFDPFPAQTHQTAIDRAIASLQETDEGVTRSLRAPIGETPMAALPGRITRANKVSAYDNNGDPIAIAQSTNLIVTDVSSALVLVPGTTVAQTVAAEFAVTINPCRFGALGNNASGATATLNVAAFNLAIAVANANIFPTVIKPSPGFYQLNGALAAITNGTRVIADGQRSVILIFSGSYDCITFRGASGIRCADSGMANIGIYADAMTGGNVLTLDFTQDWSGHDIFVSNPYNFCDIRQSGNVTLTGLNCQILRGTLGIYWHGTGVARNNSVVTTEIDKCDVLNLDGVLHSNNVPFGTVSTCELLVCDGYVQTLNGGNVALLAGLRGLVTKNTPGLAYPLYPSFINFQNLQMENNRFEGIRCTHVNGFQADQLFLVGSQAESGGYFGPNASKIKIKGGQINGNYYHGIQFDGASLIDVSATDCYFNSQVGSGLKSGYYIGPTSANSIKFSGGLSGKNLAAATYTELQKYGIDFATGTRCAAIGVDLSGNVTAAASNSGSITGYATCIVA